MEDKKNQMPPYLTEDHFDEADFEAQRGLKYPEYEAETRDYSEIDVIKQGGSYTLAPVSKVVFPYKYLTLRHSTSPIFPALNISSVR